jgi:hypothetical protein
MSGFGDWPIAMRARIAQALARSGSGPVQSPPSGETTIARGSHSPRYHTTIMDDHV